MVLAPSRRRSLVLLLGLALLAPVFSGAASAEEWQDPSFGRQDLAITEETLPRGWAFLPEAETAEAQKAVKALVTEAGTEAGLPATEADLLVQGFKSPAGATVTVAFVDVFVEPSKFAAALRPRAEKAGYVVRDMASPARLLLVSAPAEAREEFVALQVKASAKALGRQAFEAVAEGSNAEQGELRAKAALALDPGVAVAHLVLGLVQIPQIEKDEAAREKAVAEFKAALDEKAAVPLDATERSLANAQYGLVLLYRKTPEADAEARDALKKSVTETGDLSKGQVAVARYNLACAHSRLKELDAAFTELKAVLEVNKTTPIRGISSHWRTDDKDLDNMRADPRWQELLKTYGESSVSPMD
jgi:hypothetical protein